jgi:hypothetical protein
MVVFWEMFGFVEVVEVPKLEYVETKEAQDCV